jgi:AmmeMemoRadiSam system protein B
LTPPVEGAISLGEAVGGIIEEEPDKRIVCIGSTDLTHYGPRYGFEPQGVGPEAVRWAKNVNDKEFIDFALKLEPEKMMESAAAHSNACGPGAAAATVAAAKRLGKTKGMLLEHINSNEVMMAKMGQVSQESVGYAAIVF